MQLSSTWVANPASDARDVSLGGVLSVELHRVQGVCGAALDSGLQLALQVEGPRDDEGVHPCRDG